MKKLTFIIVFVVYVLFDINNVFGQIKYRANGKLTIGNIEPHSWFNTTLFGSVYMTGSNGHFMELNLGPSNPRISGHGGQIVFYNTEESEFNSIQVKNVYNYSDLRAKQNISKYNGGIDIVKKMKPVTYFFRQTSKLGSSKNKEIGLLAQDLEKILPNAVITDSEGHKLINYTSLIPVLIDAIKDLQKQIDELKSNKIARYKQ